MEVAMARRRVVWVVGSVLVVALVIYGVMFLNRGETQSSSQFPQLADGIVFIDEATISSTPPAQSQT